MDLPLQLSTYPETTSLFVTGYMTSMISVSVAAEASPMRAC